MMRSNKIEKGHSPLEGIRDHEKELEARDQELQRVQNELEASKSRYERFYGLAPVCYLTVDSSLNIKEANIAATRMFGTDMRELISFDLLRFVPINARDGIDSHMAMVGMLGEHTTEIELNRMDGTTFSAEIHSFVGEDNVTHMFIADVSVRKQVDTLRATLDRVILRIGSSVDHEVAIQNAIEEAAHAVQAQSSLIELNEGDRPVARFVHGLPKEIIGARRSADGSPASLLIARAKNAIAIDGTQNDPRIQWGGSPRNHSGSILAAPIKLRGELIGTIFFFRHLSADQFTEAQIDFVDKLAASLALAFGDVRQYYSAKRTKEALSESEGRFRTLIDNAPIAIGMARNGVFVYLNSMHLKMFGYQRLEELLGHPMIELFAPQDRERATEGYIRMEQGNPEATQNDFMGLRKDGSQFPFHVAVTNLNMAGRQTTIGFISDTSQMVNDRMRIEDLATRSEAERFRLRTILDTLPVIVAVVDVEGKLVDENQVAASNWQKMTSGPPDLNGYRSIEAWSSNTGVRLKEKDWPLVSALRKGETIIGVAVDVKHIDGRMVTLLLSAAPLRDIKGNIIGGVSIAQDITHQRELEQEAIEAKERAELYIDLLTHDINNMNAAVSGYLQLVLEKGELDLRSKEQISKSTEIMESSTHLIENVKKIQMLEMGSGGYGPVDIGMLLEEAIQDVKEFPGRKVTINYRGEHGKLVTASDLLKDVFANILVNAIKHSTGSVTIDIHLKSVLEDGREHYRVEIEDNGPGIPDEIKGKLFFRLQRGRTKAHGMGLGLYLVRRLIEDYHGRVRVEDRVSGDHAKGARFVVQLPATSIR